MHEGRERRRRGLINRLRRLAYGLMLSCSLPVAAGNPATAPVAATDRRTQAVAHHALFASVEGQVAMNEIEPAANSLPLRYDDDYAHLVFDDLVLDLVDARAGSSLRVSVAPMTRLRDGLGLDVQIPDLGALRLNLYARRNESTHHVSRAWRLAGSMELVRTADGSRQLAFVPELVLDGDALPGRKLGFSAGVRYSHWRSLGGAQAEDIEVPQLLFRWKI